MSFKIMVDLPTTEECYKMDNKFLAHIALVANICSDDLQNFQKDMLQDPENAFSWGDDAMKNAARMNIFGRVYIYLTKESLADVLKEIEREMLQMARFPSRSTSDCTNIMAQYKLAAIAEVVELLKTKEVADRN